MKTIKLSVIPILFIVYLMTALLFQSCNPDDDIPDEDVDDECDTCMMVYKPNIYIYPTEKMQLNVELSFPLGGKVVTSIPEYVDGWDFVVDTNGLIDNTYSYLFYESTQPDVWQRTDGWTIKATELDFFFRENMNSYGFYGQEIDDFIDYWIPRLDIYTYYSIYPQTKELINKVIELEFSEQPDNLLRLFYFVEGHNQLQNKLIEPISDNFNREEYFATEWGVIIK